MGMNQNDRESSPGDVKTHKVGTNKDANEDAQEDVALKASQTGDVKVLKQLLDAGGGESLSSSQAAEHDSFSFLDANIQGLETMDRESFHSIASVEQEIATANLNDIEVDSRDSWESSASRDSLQLFNERREVRWTRHFSKATIDDSHVLKPAIDPDQEEEEEDEETKKYCQLLNISIRQAWPLFISGFHLKLKSGATKEKGKFMISAKLIGSKSKVLLDEDITNPQDRQENSIKFVDPVLLEVPSSSTILQLQIKNLSRNKSLLRGKSVCMRNLGYVYIKVKDILQEENNRIHDFFSVQKGIPATLFCSVSLMSPYMEYTTLLQLGSQNEKHLVGDDGNHYRKVQNEEAEEVFTFGRMKHSKNKGVISRSGLSDRNIKVVLACLEEMKFEWLHPERHSNRVVDIIVVKMNNKVKEIKEIVALIINFLDDVGKYSSHVLYRKFDVNSLEKEGEKISMTWAKFANIKVSRLGRLKNTMKKCRLESTTEFDVVNESDVDWGIQMKKPDTWSRKDMGSMPHIAGSWVLHDNTIKVDKVRQGHDSKEKKLKKTMKRKKTVIARAEVYIHYLKAKKSFLSCHGNAENLDRYIYRGFKLMVQKAYISKVPAFVALVLALKESELQDCL
ncbi:hypothetical protein HOP50_11g61920 [Chloropicon primus]|uniref:Uncharacterized protein n=1 Tax=Chloropicon primus TaxID=1764295 RepID=A0A5B8MVW3_9CHLO|nr:hypothetical protein A3770_11p61700 [Chloropicon primus]UPR02865.1 hypothetical protein HOP50_11g61920 [Chloropicon primus]|eukprot:QDZ23652.1 hypothetical protein A3770_11p61700 [Chloropicon primus]